MTINRKESVKPIQTKPFYKKRSVIAVAACCLVAVAIFAIFCEKSNSPSPSDGSSENQEIISAGSSVFDLGDNLLNIDNSEHNQQTNLNIEDIEGTWRYVENDFVYQLTFDTNSHAEYWAGWLDSEWASAFIGTYTMQNYGITMNLSETDIRYENEKTTPFNPSTKNTTLELEPQLMGKQLIVTLISGDQLYSFQKIGEPVIYDLYNH